jgi:hypothetical protein
VIIGEYGDRISDQTARGPDGGGCEAGSIAARERDSANFWWEGGAVGLGQ